MFDSNMFSRILESSLFSSTAIGSRPLRVGCVFRRSHCYLNWRSLPTETSTKGLYVSDAGPWAESWWKSIRSSTWLRGLQMRVSPLGNATLTPNDICTATHLLCRRQKFHIPTASCQPPQWKKTRNARKGISVIVTRWYVKKTGNEALHCRCTRRIREYRRKGQKAEKITKGSTCLEAQMKMNNFQKRRIVPAFGST